MRRLYIYYNNDIDLSTFELESIVNDLLDDWLDGGATFGYVDDECRSYGDNVSVGMVDINEDADIDEVMELLEDEFLADGIEIIDIQVG